MFLHGLSMLFFHNMYLQIPTLVVTKSMHVLGNLILWHLATTAGVILGLEMLVVFAAVQMFQTSLLNYGMNRDE